MVVMKIIISPVFPLCSQEKQESKLTEQIESRFLTPWSEALHQGPARLSFLLSLSPTRSGENNCYADKIATGYCLKENKISPKPQPVSLSLFPAPSAAFPQVPFVDSKEEEAKSPSRGARADSSVVVGMSPVFPCAATCRAPGMRESQPVTVW